MDEKQLADLINSEEYTQEHEEFAQLIVNLAARHIKKENNSQDLSHTWIAKEFSKSELLKAMIFLSRALVCVNYSGWIYESVLEFKNHMDKKKKTTFPPFIH